MTRTPRPTAAALATVAARWPTLLAWFLAGWVARVLLLRLAAAVGTDDAVWGLLLLPLAVLARLVSYVAIFLVVRDALQPRVEDPEKTRARALARLRRRVGRIGSSLVESILPFFIIYAAWAIIDQDIVAYGRTALDVDQYRADDALTVSFGWLAVSMVVLALGLRLLLERYAARLGRWTDAALVYLEAVWVLVTVLVARTLLAGVPEWLGSRRMVAWGLDRVADLRASFAWVDGLVDGLGPAWSVLSDVVLLPLAWLALAGVVFAASLAQRDPHHVSRVRARYAALPSRWQRALAFLTRGVLERWEPVHRVGTLAWRAGPLPVAAYLLAFAAVTALPRWLELGVAHVLGPHERTWWQGVTGLVDLGLNVLVVPLQLAVVAIALFRITAQADSRQPAPPDPAAAPAAATSAT